MSQTLNKFFVDRGPGPNRPEVQCVGHTKGKVEENNDARIRLSQDDALDPFRVRLP